MENFDVVIIGGSYAGLSAAMSLGRARRNVLVIDDGKPCNIQTPHSHNFLTQDGNTPLEISTSAKQQLQKYKTVHFYNGRATSAANNLDRFEVSTQSNEKFSAKKLILATGVKDIMPSIDGFAECWGISVIHCPYCHGYEYSDALTGILANGDMAFEMSKLISNWTANLTIFTNGKSTLTTNQVQILTENKINIVDSEIAGLNHTKGALKSIRLTSGDIQAVSALYAKPKFEQSNGIPLLLGCELAENNHIKVDAFQKTSTDGVFACGDNATMMRAVSYAVAMGGVAGAMANREIIEDNWMMR